MRAAVYLRVSTDRQDERNQEPECNQLAMARGWKWVTYHEVESGAKDRPQWRKVLEDARRGEIRAVVVWSLDRVGRRMFELIGDIRELDRLGVQVVSVRESWLDTGGPARALLLAIFAWVAEHERERLRERTRAGLARAKAEGKTLGRPRRALTIHALGIALQMDAEGIGLRSIASSLAAQGQGTYAPNTIRKAIRCAKNGSRN